MTAGSWRIASGVPSRDASGRSRARRCGRTTDSTRPTSCSISEHRDAPRRRRASARGGRVPRSRLRPARRPARRAGGPTAPRPRRGRWRRAGAGRAGGRSGTRVEVGSRSNSRDGGDRHRRQRRARRGGRGRCRSRATSLLVARRRGGCRATVRSSKSSSDWNERPSAGRARRVGDQPSIGYAVERDDARGSVAMNPVTASMNVVLPAPFGPISPRTSPGRTSRVTPSSATTPPKRTLRSLHRQVRAGEVDVRGRPVAVDGQIEAPCRRDGGGASARTFVSAKPLGLAKSTAMSSTPETSSSVARREAEWPR